MEHETNFSPEPSPAQQLHDALENLVAAALDTIRPFYPQPHHRSLGMAIIEAEQAIKNYAGEQ